MTKEKDQNKADHIQVSEEEYQRLIESLRIRLNVLNASIFLMEEKMGPLDEDAIIYIERINSELEQIRKLITPYPVNQN